MRIENVKVYDLEESIIVSGYPMQTDMPNMDYETENLLYWGEYNISEIITILKENPNLEVKNNIINITLDNITTQISAEDLKRVMLKKWSYNQTRGYVRDSKGETELHRYVMNNPEGYDVDHIDRNKLNNTRENLRICTHRENSINKDILKNNTSGFMGVYWNKQKNKWDAKIQCNKKTLNLGRYENKEDAIKSRLQAEKDLFGEFAPQRHLFNEYQITPEDNIITIEKTLGFTPSLEKAIKHYNRAKNLATTGMGEGHNQFLTGIRVNFDLTFSNKAWVELERYRFVEFVSSQSTMHKITKLDIRKQCNKYVWDVTILRLEGRIKLYNSYEDKTSDEAKELYLEILYNVPAGFELTARLTTNYRALKTVYSQRKNHKLPEWRELCKWIETLPNSKELIIN